MNIREAWIIPFQKIGISRDETVNMTEEEFQNRCEFALECGYLPEKFEEEKKTSNNFWSKFKNATTRKQKDHPLPTRTPSSQIREDQNQEYIRAEKQAKEQQEIENQRKELEQIEQNRIEQENIEKAKREAILRQKTKDQIFKLAQELAEPSSNSVQIAIMMPSRKRIIRKFSKNSPADDVYIFTAAQEELFDEDSVPIQFELVLSYGGTLKKGKTLEDQGITTSTLFNVITLDEDEQ